MKLVLESDLTSDMNYLLEDIQKNVRSVFYNLKV